MTLKMTPPYSEWGVEERARDAGFRTAEVVHFDQKVFPGYRHRTTEKDAKTFVVAVEAEVCATATPQGCLLLACMGGRGVKGC